LNDSTVCNYSGITTQLIVIPFLNLWGAAAERPDVQELRDQLKNRQWEQHSRFSLSVTPPIFLLPFLLVLAPVIVFPVLCLVPVKYYNYTYNEGSTNIFSLKVTSASKTFMFELLSQKCQIQEYLKIFLLQKLDSLPIIQIWFPQ